MKIDEDLVLKDLYAAVVGYYQMKEYGECLKKVDICLRWPGLDNDDLHDIYFYKACCEDELGMYRQAYDTVRNAYRLLPGCNDCEELYSDVVKHMGKEVERLYTQGIDLERADEMLNVLTRDEVFSEDHPGLATRLSKMRGTRGPGERGAHHNPGEIEH